MTTFPNKFFALIFLFGLLLSLSFYQSSLEYYFFQDDFFEINISKANNVGEYLSFFKFRGDIIAYRPISLQNYFFISSTIFDLNPVGFRFIIFLLFLASSFLIFNVVSKITHNSKIGLLTSSLWLLSSIHFMALTWIAAAYNIIGTFFWLLTSFFFLKFIRSQKPINYLLAFLSFLTTIGSFEFSITWPVIFGFYYFIVLKNSPVKVLKIFLPFISISLIYLVLRFLLIKVPQIPEYHVTLNVESLKAFIWYLLWTLNIPEEFKKQVTDNLIFFNPIFLAQYWPLFVKTFMGALWIVTLGILVPSFFILKNKIPISLRLIVFCIFWFTAGISPVLLLPNHTFTMYLTLASIGVYLLLAYFLVKSNEIILAVPVILIWILISISTLNFYKINSWMIESQKVAEEFSFNIKQQFPILPENSIVYYYLPYSWQHQALLEDNAIEAIYNDRSLSIYYNEEALLKIVDRIDDRPVFVYIP